MDGDEADGNSAPIEKGARPGDAFGIDLVGERVVYVVDCSSELGLQRYATATRGVVKSLATLRSDQEFAVVLFADDVYPMFFPDLNEETYLPSESVRSRVEEWLESFNREALERSRAEPALEYALSLEPTDLVFVAGSAPDAEIVDAVSKLNGRKATIHAIGIAVDAPETLRRLARSNGGVYREAR